MQVRPRGLIDDDLTFHTSVPDTVHWFPVLGDTGQFLIKDLVLFGASIWTAAETRLGISRIGVHRPEAKGSDVLNIAPSLL